MYQISDTQIDFILEDLSARGLEMVSLQQDLLDHICCIIENQLEESGNFEACYRKTITTFYKEHLWEIEEETIRLQTFKNYYAMKKTMILSGAATTILLSAGLIFKFMHWPGASVMLVLGIVISSLVFLPIMFTLRVQEKNQLSDKIILGLGSLCGALMSFHVLFKVMHWPYANVLGTTTMCIFIGVFLPVYFFSGIRKEENKVNTIVSSVLIVIGCALVLILMRSPKTSRIINTRHTADYLRTEQLLSQIKNQKFLKADSTSKFTQLNNLAQNIFNDCELIKTDIVEGETGVKIISSDFENKEQLIGDNGVKDVFDQNEEAEEALHRLSENIDIYNSQYKNLLGVQEAIPYAKAVLELRDERSVFALNTLAHVQLFMMQSQRSFLTMK